MLGGAWRRRHRGDTPPRRGCCAEAVAAPQANRLNLKVYWTTCDSKSRELLHATLRCQYVVPSTACTFKPRLYAFLRGGRPRLAFAFGIVTGESVFRRLAASSAGMGASNK